MNLARRYPTGVATTLPVRAKLPARAKLPVRAKVCILPTTSAWTAPARRRSRCDHRARRTHRGHRVGVGYNALHRPARRPAAREDHPHPGDRAGERGLRRYVRTRLSGRLPERHTPPQGRAAPELLRHRARQSRQLHRPGLRPGADAGHPGRLRGQRLRLRQRHPRHAGCRPGRQPRAGGRCGLRVPGDGAHHRGPTRREVPAQPDEPRCRVARLRAGHGQHAVAETGDLRIPPVVRTADTPPSGPRTRPK